MRLYEVTLALRAIEAVIEDNGGELSPELEAQLDGLQESLAQKADAIAALIIEAGHAEDSLQDEAERFIRRADIQRRKISGLKSYLLYSLAAIGQDKVKGERFTVSAQKNGSSSIAWAGQGDLPPEFTRTRVELDGDKARKALAAGTLPEGFAVTRGTHLRIR